MIIEIFGTKFINAEKFVTFLEKNLKRYYPESLRQYLNELEQGYCETGNTEYEIDSFYTISVNTETLSFDAENFTNDNGNTWQTIITF